MSGDHNMKPCARDEIIRMAREAGATVSSFHGRFVMYPDDIERFAAFVAAAEREKVAAWMIARGYATGHGDTIEELLKELEWQISEKLTSNHTAPFLTDKRPDKIDTRKSWTA